MSSMPDDSRFTQRLNSVLDTRQDELDPAIRRRLREARHAALRQLDPQPRSGLRGWLAAWFRDGHSLGAVALAAALVAAVLWWPGPQATLPDAAWQDLDVIAVEDSLQLYEELDFYEWLAVSDVEAG